MLLKCLKGEEHAVIVSFCGNIGTCELDLVHLYER
jgi:hypothetical protein